MQDQNNEYPGEERRKYPRLSAAVVEYFPVGKEESTETSFTRDVGAGGICIIVSERIEKDTILALKIYLPDIDTPIEAKGKVVWINESSFLRTKASKKGHYDLGIEFVTLGEKDREKIYHYVRNPSG